MEQYSRQFSLPPTDQHPGFTPDAAMQGGIRKILNRKNMGEGPFIVIHTGPSDPIREWPHEKWTELVELLHKNGYADIVQIGVSRHASFGKIAVDQLHGTVSLLDELTLEETLGVISLARLYIGIDSGPLHLAAMARIPAVGIFGAITPQLRFSKDYCSHFVVSRLECQGCGHYPTPTHYSKDCPFHIRCMKEIGVEEVLQACLEKLKLSGR